MKAWPFILGWIILSLVALAIAMQVRRADRTRRRLFISGAEAEPRTSSGSDDPGLVGRWLYLAGFRSPSAAYAFILITLVLFLLGLGLAILIEHSGWIDRGIAAINSFPGGALDIVAPLIYALPWLVFGILAMLPWLVVRSIRKERVIAIEQDLPLVLEMLSTLAEAGLSFDPALDRVLEAQPPARPLARELRTFRDETRAGRPRVQSFRRLARRVEVTPLSTFVSALVQAEQSSAGIAMVLREQADDLRNRRRERALEAATALPVKRLIPLFICFLPGIFVWALGPSFFQLYRFLDIFTRNRGLR